MVRASLLFLTLHFFLEAQAGLPIFIEDDHSGSFHILAEHLSLEEPHSLILFDSHSDASHHPRSDDLRRAIREVANRAERKEVLDTFRSEGIPQVYSWIEPLMPAPLREVLWVAPSHLDSTPDARTTEAHEFLDARLAFEHRDTGSLAFRERFRSIPRDAVTPTYPAIASLDLDYFMELSPGEIPDAVARIWDHILLIPDLRAITICLSRPWLTDDEQAFTLLESAFAEALSVQNADIFFEPFPPRGPDYSERAKALTAKNVSIPRLHLPDAPPSLRQILLRNSSRIRVRFDSTQWDTLLSDWRSTHPRWSITADETVQSTDGIWRSHQPPTLRVRHYSGAPPPMVTRWFLLTPSQPSFSYLPDTAASKAFVGESSSPHVRWDESLLAETHDGTLPSTILASTLGMQHTAGAVRLIAEVNPNQDSPPTRTSTAEIRVAPKELSLFHQSLAEQWNTPYHFGVGIIRANKETGPEIPGLGNDCANFIIYALRRLGHALPWGDPSGLRHFPELVTPLNNNAIDQGILIDAGNHVGVVWKDLPPLTSLGHEDLIAHHLSGFPEIIPLGQFLSERQVPTFTARSIPCLTEPVFFVAGDVCLDHSSTTLPLPPTAFSKALRICNLECSITETELPPSRKKRFLFQAPPAALTAISEAKISAVSLANNHTGDFGEAGLLETIQHLDSADIGHFGSLAQPEFKHTTEDGETWTILGVNFIETDNNPHVLTLPRDQGLITELLSSPSLSLVVPHWGDEYTSIINEDQKQWARWLIQQGAYVIAGAGSHHPQATDFYQGRPIHYSTGNLYFPSNNGPPGFHTPIWLPISSPDHLRNP